MRHATFRQLKVFETVARRLSYSRAAEELHLSQPAVSTQIRQLELHVGVPLFEQLGKKVYLTQAGETMLKHCRLILNQFREAEEAMEIFKGITSGTLNVGVNSAADYYFPHILSEFKQLHPQSNIQLTVINRNGLVQKLNDNEIDMVIMCRPPTEIDVVAEKFAPHPYVIVARPDHPLAKQKNIPIESLFKYPFISRELGSDTRDAIREKFKDNIGELKIILEVQSTESIKQAVRSGMGLAFVSAFNINLELQLNHLCILDVESFPAMRHWFIVYRKEKLLPSITQSFIAFLHERGTTLLEDFTPLKPKDLNTESPKKQRLKVAVES